MSVFDTQVFQELCSNFLTRGMGKKIEKDKLRSDDRKRYTETIPSHRAVQQNTPRFFIPIRDADWSTQSRTGFDTQTLRYIVSRLLSSAVTVL